MYNNFIQRIKNIKQELLNLKTAQARGLGSVSFFGDIESYSYTSVGGSASRLRVSVMFSESQANAPYCQCYLSNAQYFNPASINWANHTLTFDYECYVNNVTIDGSVKIIASAPMQNVSVEAI